MIENRCPMCGNQAASTVMVLGVRILGCPCVGDRAWIVPCRWARGGWVRLVLGSDAEHHDPGDEDRR